MIEHLLPRALGEDFDLLFLDEGLDLFSFRSMAAAVPPQRDVSDHGRIGRGTQPPNGDGKRKPISP